MWRLWCCGCSASEPLLRQYIHQGLGGESRAAAIWTLGILHAGRPDLELARQLLGRLTDDNQVNPEYPLVKDMAAISLGRMKAEAVLDTLRTLDQAGNPYCRWAVEQITGETLPPCPAVEARQVGWFLEPID